MENQITINLPCKIGDKLYKLSDYQIKEYTVEKFKIEATVSAEFGISRRVIIITRAAGSSCTGSIDEDNIGSTYFFSKKAITKKIVDQL